MLHGETLTLKCSYSREFFDFAWLAGDRRIYHAAIHSSEVITDYVNERIQRYEFEGNSHKITIAVNKSMDDNETFTCRVAFVTGITDESEKLYPILSK